MEKLNTNCALCCSLSCCPEHCCNWDECECNDCEECGAKSTTATQDPQIMIRSEARPDTSNGMKIM